MVAKEERPDMISASATEMLRQDHRKVKDLFDEFDKGRKGVVSEALKELRIHSTLEEELFYPVVREQLGEPDKAEEAVEEHHIVSLLIDELERMERDNERYAAKFRVLAEAVRHHIQEEESDIIPRMEQSGFDLVQLGADMALRKRDLSERPKGRGVRRSRKDASSRRSHAAPKRAAGRAGRRSSASKRASISRAGR